jgi:16S rRNA (guanine527-N7)-methyltransferase
MCAAAKAARPPDMAEPAEMAATLAANRAEALALLPVSRETAAKLDVFVDKLVGLSPHINLIARSTVPNIWTRHVADSLQLLALAPDAKCWVDLGSGAGFPGIVIACALANREGATVHLVESIGKKAAFLRDVVNELQIPAVVHAVRIEDFVKNFKDRADVVCARALAPLDSLLKLAEPLLKSGAQGLFPKGQDVEGELTRASKYWTIDAELVPSKTSAEGRIVVVRGLRRRSAKS